MLSLITLSIAALSACGGGGGGTSTDGSTTANSSSAGDSSTSSSAGTSSSATTNVTLTNLPSAHTQSTSASIQYESSTGSVYCRLDGYTPIACPNPFVLGATPDQALSAGTHTVDYYVDSGSGIDLNNPTASYTWTVDLAAATGSGTSSTATTTNTSSSTGSSSSSTSTSTGSTSTSTGSTSATALAFATAGSSARVEAPSDSDSASYGTKTLTNGVIPPLSNLQTVTRGGITRFGPATVDGRSVITHRIRQGDPLRNGGNRSELSYSGYNFANGEDVWFAAAYKFDSDCDPSTSGGASDRFLVQQTHQENTSPSPIGNPFSLTYAGGGASQGLNWVVTYQGNDYELYRTPIVIGQWMRVITHYRSGFNSAGDAPVMEAWVAYGNGAYTKLSPTSSMSANQQFGDPLSTKGSNNDWPKIGLYKWTTGSWGSSPSRTVYSSGLYAGKGTNLFNEAAAALSSAGF